ncbi:UDP-N-acetylmuramoyl-tripeptide--D-alanyl-D-alanine ligase [Reinekea sp.]|jgi:UDP-N-acetylmuramoyl-tripeptide--D-alanyl-D-alanine ligase|uniref:UDP-N-acetylmuramoyl-tripeptide--D-alanyl-D- alanine ligase n=1 Tax=Reinekea sp. TaxID=1970455 RepID=UPI002A7EF4E0|nr:UDP-N-acetylmuramoyl-tripeptide--D-alanyl-D-alanine ligase [Reinekea sp.]
MWTNPTLSEWALLCAGRLLGDDAVVSDISTDSRSLKEGDIYVALTGPFFDGHNYISTAVYKGARAIVVDHPIADLAIAQLVVPDTKRALGFLAGLLRDRFSGQVIALTGSAGKTSTRAMLANILGLQPGLLSTEGNFNNDIGVAKTWFRLTDRHQRVLLEFGANAPGEIDWLGSISRPHFSLLINAGAAHTEGFGGLDGVRDAKGEIIDRTDIEGGCILNHDDPAITNWLKRAGDRRVISFGKHTDADVCLLAFTSTGEGSDFTISLPDGDISVSWSMLGRHMALNAAAAAATAWLAGVSSLDIAEGLSAMKPEPGRMEPVESNHGGALIHDAYNASPVSFRAAIDVLADIGGDTLLIAGDMAELGIDSAAYHREVGQYARGKIGGLWTVGEQAGQISAASGGHHFNSIAELLAVLPARIDHETTILVKGSRSSGMERVIDALRRKY